MQRRRGRLRAWAALGAALTLPLAGCAERTGALADGGDGRSVGGDDNR